MLVSLQRGFEAESAGAAAWVLLLHGTVICPSRDYTSHSSSRIGVIASPPRSEMNVTMHHSLTGTSPLLIPTLKPITEGSALRIMERASVSRRSQARDSAVPKSK